MAIVDDLVADIDRRILAFEGALDDLDRTHHTRAEAARFCQNHLQRVTGAVGRSFL